MSGRQAKVITPALLRRMLNHVRRHQHPERNQVFVLLSVKAGLRAAEIAQLDWSMVLNARGRVGDAIAVHDLIAKRAAGG
jgi:integrase/recombinase XerD